MPPLAVYPSITALADDTGTGRMSYMYMYMYMYIMYM